jgi:hypothetical protein
MKILKKHPALNKLIWISLLLAALIAYIMLTNPNTIPLPLVLVPFILIGVFLYQLTALMLVLRGIEKGHYVRRLLPGSISFIGVALLVLASLHQLSWKDVFLVALFTVLFWLYVGRADFLHK